MSSQVAANQSQSTKKTISNLAKALLWARRALAFVNAFKALAYQDGYGATNAVIPAGGNLAPPQTVTVGESGVFDVTVFAGWTSPAGTVTPVLAYGPHGGPLSAIVVFPASTAAGAGFVAGGKRRINTLGAIGTQWDFAWHTSLGDQAATLGNGPGTAAASGLIVAEAFI